MRHVLAVATKNHFASQSGQWSPRRLLASIVVWLVAMHAQKRNFWTNRFGWARWARHINDYENAHCTRTLSSPCYMRFIWHNGRRHSFLIYELLWDNTRRALMHTSLVVAAPEFVNSRDWNKPLLFYIFHRPWFEKKLYMHAWKFRYGLTRVSWIYINATSEFSVCMYVCILVLI